MSNKENPCGLIQKKVYTDNLKEGDSLTLGVSGGADSVAMLLIFNSLKEKLKINLTVRHFEHGIRGEESRADAVFVKNLCDKLDIPFIMGKGDVPGIAKENGLSLEEAARILRYEFLTSGEEDYVATAHNVDDNAETVLFNLVRGSGTRGLCGISQSTNVNGKKVIRPLLNVTRTEIEAYLKENNQTFRQDSTNKDTDYSRNKIRHEIMPLLKDINKNAVSHINHSSSLIKGLREYSDNIINEYLKEYSKDNRLKTRELNKYNKDLINEIIYEWIKLNRKSIRDIGKVHLDALSKLAFSHAGKALNLPGFTVKSGYGELVILPERSDNNPGTTEDFSPSVTIDLSELNTENTRIFNNIQFTFNIFPYKNHMKIPKESYTKWFDCDKMDSVFALRFCEREDYFTINQKLNKKTFRRYCIDEKIPSELRHKIPLIAKGHHIIWAPGYRISEAFKIDDRTKRILEITVKELNHGRDN